MAVKITKPEINIREKLSELDRKPGDFGGKTYKADSSDEWNKITNLESSPLPYWTGYRGSVIGQTNQTHTFLDSGNQRYYTINNGNNGPNARFRMHGVLRGEFEFGYTCSYSWGYAGVDVIPRSNFDPRTCYVKDLNGPHARTLNNNSNNETRVIYKTDYGQSSYIDTGVLTPGAAAGTMFKVWRNSSGMIYFRPPQNGTDYSLFATDEDIFIVNETQAPSYVKLEYVLCPSH